MNTADLIERVSIRNEVAREHTRKIVDDVFAAIVTAAANGEEVVLTGFGRFRVSDVAERQGRNPATGEAMTIAATKRLSFVPARQVKQAIAG